VSLCVFLGTELFLFFFVSSYICFNLLILNRACMDITGDIDEALSFLKLHLFDFFQLIYEAVICFILREVHLRFFKLLASSGEFFEEHFSSHI